MYRRMVLALLTTLVGVTVFASPAGADPDCYEAGNGSTDCITFEMEVRGKRYRLDFVHEVPFEPAPVTVAVEAGLGKLADSHRTPWEEAVLTDFRAAATALGPATLVFVRATGEPSAPEAVVVLVSEAGVAIAAGLTLLSDGLADPKHAALYDALALQDFARARQALSAAVG